jgi:hypothetical protein
MNPRLSTLALLIALAPAAQALPFYWGEAISTCNNGSYNFSANCWTNSPGSTVRRGSMPPNDAGHSLVLENSRGGAITVNVNASMGNLFYRDLVLDNTGSGFLGLAVASGSLSFSSRSSIGQTGSGRLAVSGGVADFGDLTVGATTSARAELLVTRTGSLTGTSLYLGVSGQGLLSQDGSSGVAFTQQFMLGANAGSLGRYEMAGGVAGLNQFTVGDAGRGEVLQTGGDVNAQALTLGGSGGQGFYELLGGSLNVGGNLSGPGGELLLNGGTLQVVGGITIARMGIGTQGSFALAAGRSLSAQQTLQVDGSLLLAGGSLGGGGTFSSTGSVSGHGRVEGSLRWNASGSTTVSGGRLVLANGDRTSNSGLWTFGPGGVLELAADSLLRNSGQFLLGGASVVGAGQLVNANGGVMQGPGTVQVLVLNSGSLVLDAGQLRLTQGLSNSGDVQLLSASAQLSGAAIGNGGLIQGRGRINNAVQNDGGRVQAQGGVLVLAGGVASSGGVLAADEGATLRLSGPAFNNLGRIELGGGTFDAGNQAVGNAGTVSGAGVWRSGLVRQQGLIQIGSGVTEWQAAMSAEAGSRLIVSGLSRFVMQGALDLQGGAELRVSEGSAAAFFGDVQLRTGALVTGSGLKFFEAGLSIGNSPATLAADGDLSLGSGASYLAELGLDGHDRLQVQGSLQMGGLLRVVALPGLSFREGQRFDLFDWGRLAGQFAQLDFSAAALPQGLRWDSSQLYVDGSLAVAAVPEPSAWLLMLAGLLAVSRTAARRRRAQP